MINEELVDRIVKNLQIINPEKIILFGSYAYGIPTSLSDIDLLIIKDIPAEDVRRLRLHIKKLLYNSFKGRLLSFDIVVDSEKRVNDRINIGDLYYNEIYNKGKIIYAK